jgi:NHLM bacteriocin system ABC transporter peptidase/ATP-binding protein
MSKKIKKPIRKGAAKVPVVMQMEALECGAACLTMVLAYYGKWLPLEQVRADCGVSRDGSNAKNILVAARRYGLKAQGFRYEPEDLKREGKFPCIIHWNFNHFVVCDGFSGDYAIINDPARGETRVPMKVFDKSFTGVCLSFEASENFEPGGKPKSVWAFAKSRLRGSGPMFALVILTSIITSVIGLVSPALSGVFTDVLLPGENSAWLIPFCAVMLGIAAIQIVIAAIDAIYLLKLEGKFAIIANATFFWHILRLPISFYSQRMAGDIAGRQSTNEGIASSIVKQIAPLFLQSIMMVFYFVVMIRYSYILTIVSLVGIIANFFTAGYISKRRVALSGARTRSAALMTSAQLSGIEMIETIKASGAENGFFEKWSGYQATANSMNIKESNLNIYVGGIPAVVSQIISTIILALGIFLVTQDQFTAGMLLAFQGYLALFTAPVNQFIRVGQTINEMRTNMERIEDVMSYKPDVSGEAPLLSEGGETEYDKLSGNIEIKNITFGYSPLGEPLLKDFSISIKQGQRIALVGSSGCGKSTVSKLVSGMYRPWSGELLYDGKPIDEINRAVFTSSLAVVDQDIILFADSISNNIKMWDTSIEDFEMIIAARDARLHEDIMRREGGYQYKMNEGGSDFSGGQRQRMEIARALAADPTIVILDEATSALDAKTEYETVQHIKDRGITCIVIAHRLSTIRDCDEIIVMDKGRIAERGTHDELLEKSGLYSQLVSTE